MLLKSLLSDHYAPINGISDRTIRLYGFTIGSFEKHLGRPAETTDLNEVEVARFLLARAKARCPATASKDRAQLHALWEFAARRSIVGEFPLIRRIVVPERIPEAWTSDELSRLLAAASATNGFVAGVPAGLFWTALLMVLYETGERIGATLQVRWDDVRNGMIVFRAETRKAGRRDTCRALSEQCQEALCAIQSGNSDLVFQWDRSYGYLWNIMGKICKRAGLPENRRSKFHRIRKTTASYYQAAGGSAQSLLDHSSPAVTRRYLDPRIVAPKPAFDLLPKISFK
jgi:integrase